MLAIVLAWLLLPSAVDAQAVDTRPPEAIIRALVKAMVGNDVAEYERLTIPDPRRSRLVTGGRRNEDALRELDEDPSRVQVRITSPYRLKGKDVQPDAQGQYPTGTTARFVASYRSPMVVSLVRQPEGWRIDLRWWLAMVDMASGPQPTRDSADYAVRMLTAALIRLDRQVAADYAVDGQKRLDVLFAGAPSQREPSGVLDETVGEMPLVEIRPGEFSVLPSGRIVEGAAAEDMKVLVGLFGPVEVPYVLRRINGAWKVEAEPYFALLLR